MSVDPLKLMELKNAMNNRGFANSEQRNSNLGNKPKASGGYNANNGSKPNRQNPAVGRGSYNGSSGRDGYNNNATNPTAPYNFIKLNDRIVQPPLAEVIGNAKDADDVTAIYSKYINSGKKFTGYFDVSVKNLTPLYIAGEDGFFSNGKDICIPGSSMRGCLKNTFKILTNSAFRSNKENLDLTDKHLYFRSNKENLDLTDKHLYFRSFASADSKYKSLYTDRMLQLIDKKQVHIAKAGIMVCKDGKYYICPAKLSVEKGIINTLVPGKDESIKMFVGLNPNTRGEPYVMWHNNYVDVFTGKNINKTSFYRFSDVKWDCLLEIEVGIIHDYLDDLSRSGVSVIPKDDEEKNNNFQKRLALNPQGKNLLIKQNAYSCYGKNNILSYAFRVGEKILKKIITDYKLPYDLLTKNKNAIYNRYANDGKDNEIAYPKFMKGAEAFNYVIPCFYVEENGVVKHFGFNRYYRIPYVKSVGNHIPCNINSDSIDFADAVFGKKESWSSRVFFEDLYLDNESKGNMHNKKFHKILATPKPTSFQFYLEKDGKKASYWESDANIRGYKMYWHQKMSWEENNPDKQNEKMTCEIAPLVEKENTFVGRIRFENLDEVELGALCALFSLGKKDGICYKLGMGKPIGMGTIELGAKLYVQNKDYYSTLFDDNGFAKCVQEKNIQDFTDIFDSYMKKQLSGTSFALYNERMEELRLIMSTNNMNNPLWNNDIRYMDVINNPDDKKIMNRRIPLPSIRDVVKKKK